MTGLILRLLIIVILNIFAFGTGVTQHIGLLLTFVISLVSFIASYCSGLLLDMISEIIEGLDFGD